MTIFIICEVILTVIVATIAFRLGRSLKAFAYTPRTMPSEILPTVSVCIPARNEMHALAGCLERVLASNYEKLEIIVFDDSSADDTSVLIRSFAHAGVRFVPGPALPAGWLGKNHALEVLADEASGTYLLYLDVDTFIQPNTISQLVAFATMEKADMLSIVPGRNDAWRTSVLFGHLRYFWQLVLASPKHPKAAASLWMVKRTTLLDEIKGFESFKASVEPEIHIATLLGMPAYRCLVNTAELGVTYEKKWLSQVETSQRLLYPMFGHTPLKGFLGLLLMLFLNLPLATVLYGLASEWTMIQAASLWFIFAFMAIYGVYVNRFWSRGWWAGALLWPVVILQELILYLLSLRGYAYRTITWKGRPVSVATSKGDSLVIDE